jgi:putative Holliday junction resolvase
VKERNEILDGSGGMGRLMALDLGEKRIGVALSDQTHSFARAFSVFKRKSRIEDFERIRQIIDDKKVNLLIVGLPISASGVESVKAAWVRDYVADLENYISIEIELWDESFSTVDAEASLRSRGIKGRKRRERVDSVAAAFILQSYLDEHHRS